MRVQRGEHPLLAGVRRAQERDEPRRRRGEGEVHLRGLHLNTLPQGGEFQGQKCWRSIDPLELVKVGSVRLDSFLCEHQMSFVLN